MEDTIDVIRSRKLKTVIHYNDQKNNDKTTNNDLKKSHREN